MAVVLVEDRELRGRAEIGGGGTEGVFVVVLGVGEDVGLVDSSEFHFGNLLLIDYSTFGILS